MRALLILVLGLASWVTEAQSIQDQIIALIQEKLPHASVAVLAKDPESGQTLVSYNPDLMLTPASNIKIFTAAAAYYQLGKNFKFKTSLYKKDKNLYLQFTGSPAFTSSDLEQLVATVKDTDMNPVPGDVLIDQSRYIAPNHPSGITYDDLGWYYEAPSSALIINENKEAYTFISAKKFNLPVEIKPEKNSTQVLHLNNEIITVGKAQAKDHCEFHIQEQDTNTLRLFGCMAQMKDPRYLQFAIPHPEALAERTILQTLQKNNIAFMGKIKDGRLPEDAELINVHHSKKLPALLAHMLQDSDNLYADSFTKTLGFKLSHEGSYKQGVYAIKAILAKHTPLAMDKLVLADGQGTRYNLIAASQMMQLLETLYQDKGAKAAVLDNLAEMGVSGTLKDRMQKTPLEKKVFAKTGTMHDISALSGLMLRENGKPLLFCIIINGVDSNILNAKKLEEAILTKLYSTSNTP